MPLHALPDLPAAVSPERLDALRIDLSSRHPDLELIQAEPELTRLSRDFHDYSPPLQAALQGRRAQLAVRVRAVEQVLAVAAACARHGVPLTPRGAGTGNYGQCVPLAGGVVIDLTGLRRLRHLDAASGVFCAEAGCQLAELDQQLAGHGRALRLVPSTYRSATLGGFIAGGSGGIGSLRWGFLRDPGQLLGLEVVTVEAEPRLLQLDAAASEPLIHAYGTNGIITALTMASSDLVAWQQLVVGFDDWRAALAVLRELPQTALLLNAMALLEAPVAARMPWPPGCPAPQAGEHRLLLLAAPDALAPLLPWLEQRGGQGRWRQAQGSGRGLPLRELTWNHTTLHWRAHAPDWTYLQLQLPRDPWPLMAALRERWGEDLLWHLEAVRQQGAPGLVAMPLLRWRGLADLEALIQDCVALGARCFDPHVVTVEAGGLGVVDADQVTAKRRHDPAGLLNPGKLAGWSAASSGDPLSRSPG
jgi:FAD/FMN-containing dehydrogenase